MSVVGAACVYFEPYPTRQFVNKTIYNNILEGIRTCSNIKILPVTMPEPRTMDRGPLTGVTQCVSPSDLDLIIGGGPQGAGPWNPVNVSFKSGVILFLPRHVQSVHCPTPSGGGLEHYCPDDCSS